MLKRTVLIFVVVGLIVPAVAYAATITCTGGRCEGTKKDDTITGSSRGDKIQGKAGNDEITEPFAATGPSFDSDVIYGGDGRDEINDGNNSPFEDRDLIYGDGGRDTINVDENNVPASAGEQTGPDKVNCGGGEDTVIADPNDVLKGCENVTIDAPPAG